MQVLSSKKYYFFIYLLLIIFLIFFFFLELSLGPIKISFKEVLENLFFPTDKLESRLIFDTRLPRAITACLVGAALGLAGMNLQFISQNPMACPSLLGINQGAGLGIVLTLAFNPFCHPILYLFFSLIGAGIATGLIFYISNKVGITPLKFILAGQAINALFYAFIQAILIFLPTRSGVILINLNGSLAGSSWELLKWTFFPVLLSLGLNILNLKNLHLLSFGKTTATSVGLNYKFNIAFFLFLTVLLSSFSVALIGPILFLPLIINHFSKLTIGQNPYLLAPFIVLFGATFILICDSLMKYLFAEKEVAIGLLIAIIGAPILILTSRLKLNKKHA